VQQPDTKKKAMRVATVLTGLTGVTAAAAAFTPAAIAKTAPAATARTAHTVTAAPDTTPGNRWIYVASTSRPGPYIYACEYYAGRTGHSCSRVYLSNEIIGEGSTYHSSQSGRAFRYLGHIMMIWGWTSSKKSFVLEGPGPKYHKQQQYTVTAKPGNWNQCTVPGGTTPSWYSVVAKDGFPSCASI
jgi:hypothetical protein